MSFGFRLGWQPSAASPPSLPFGSVAFSQGGAHALCRCVGEACIASSPSENGKRLQSAAESWVAGTLGILARTNTLKSTGVAYQCRVLDIKYEEIVDALGVIPPEDQRTAALVADVSQATRWGKTRGPTAAADIERAFGNLGTLVHRLHCQAGGAADGGLGDLGFQALARKVCSQLTTTAEKKTAKASASSSKAESESFIIFLHESVKEVFTSFFSTLREQARLRRHFAVGPDGKQPLIDFAAAVLEVREVHLPHRLREASERGALKRHEQSDSHKALLSRLSDLEAAFKAGTAAPTAGRPKKETPLKPTRWGPTKADGDETADTDGVVSPIGGKRQKPAAVTPSFEAGSITSLYVSDKDGKRDMPAGKFHAVECFEYLAGQQFPKSHSTQWPCTWFSLVHSCKRDGTDTGCSQCDSRREAEKNGKAPNKLSAANWAKLKGACSEKTAASLKGP